MLYIYSTIRAYVQLESSSNTLERYWPRHDRPPACCRPAMIVLLRFHSLKEKFGPRFRNVIVPIFTFLNCKTWHCVSRGVCAQEFWAAVERNVAEDWKVLWTLQFVLTRLFSFLPRSDVIRREGDGPCCAGDCRASMPWQLFACGICVSNTDPGTYCMPSNNENNQLSDTASKGVGGSGKSVYVRAWRKPSPFCAVKTPKY